MSAADNPHFKFVERAPYELGHLLKQLPATLSMYEPMDTDTKLQVAAIEQHAGNALRTMLCGLEALGNLLTVAALNAESEVPVRDLTSLGELISHLAVETQFLQETEGLMQLALANQSGGRQ